MASLTRFLNRSSLAWALVALTLTAAPAPLLGATKPPTIRLGSLVPRGSSYYVHLSKMGEQWRQAPGGGATLTIYPDGSMGGEADMVRRMRVRQLQAGLLSAVGLSEIEPAVAGLQSMPMIFRTLDEVDAVGQRLQPLLEARLLEKGFIVLFWVDSGWVRFFTSAPVAYPDDLKKQKLWTWAGSPDTVDIYKSAGFNPVPMETADILPGLQTGLISAVPMPPWMALGTQVYSAAPHVLELNWAPLVGAAVVTKAAWESVPSESRSAMLESAKAIGVQVKEDGRRESLEAMDAMAKRGAKIQRVTPEMEQAWRQEAEKAYPKIRGGIVPADVFDEAVKQLKEYRAREQAKTP